MRRTFTNSFASLLTHAAFMLPALLTSDIVMSADAAGDPERGRELAGACAACHGADGNSPSPAFPIIAGQHEEYLYTALLTYRDRTRDNAIMSATIVGKTEQQLRDLAAWFASQRGLGGAAGSVNDVAAAATASGALLAEGGSSVVAAQVALPDVSACPAVDGPNAGDANSDKDRDGLADSYDAAPDDTNEFVLDTNGDGRYEICNMQQLQAILTLGTGAGNSTGLSETVRMARDYELLRDLDAAGIRNWQPIGNCGPTGNCMNDLDKYGFKGSFDGRGYVIRNLTIDAPEIGGVGLFGVISSGKVVRNIELQNARIVGRAGSGTVVGSNFGTVYNCHAVGGSVSGKYAIGGLVGANAGNISFSHASVDVNGEMAAGGLVGDQNANVYASYATGAVTGQRGVGGLVGLNTRGRVVSSYATGPVSGGKDVGGLVGLNTDALLANSYATGPVAGSDLNTGGLVGFNSMSRIRNAYATGAVEGNTAVGGITGNNNGLIFQSWASGRVTGQKETGGLVGKNAEGVIQSSYWNTAGTGQTLASGTQEGELQGATDVDQAGLAQLDGSDWAPANMPDSGTGADDAELWFCDSDGSGVIEANERSAANYAWDMGDAAQLPVLRCPPGGGERQRR